jgi:hypothetical protein
MIRSLWKIDFVTAAATYTLLDYGDDMDGEPEFSHNQNTVVSAPIFLAFASAYPLGGAASQLSWTRIRKIARPRSAGMFEAAVMPWGQTGYLRVAVKNDRAMVYTRSAVTSVVPAPRIPRDQLLQKFSADLGPPSYPLIASPALITTTRAVGVAGNILNPTITGGLSSYVVTVASGALPPGYTLTSGSGLITGTPTTAGSYAWTLAVTDARGAGNLYDYTFTVT